MCGGRWGPLLQRTCLLASPLSRTVGSTPQGTQKETLACLWVASSTAAVSAAGNKPRNNASNPVGVGVLQSRQPRLPAFYGPSSVYTRLGDSEERICGELVLGERADASGALSVHPFGWMYTSIRTKKKRGKKEVVKKNPEQLETKASMPPLRLADHATTAEPPAAIAETIRTETYRAVKGRKTRRMFVFRNKYRVRLKIGCLLR
ncbi:mitochondrial ribosomal protein s35 [Cyclospora cayetanensis]|uniref:Mitochondrial ribosomal protein s35 n=1 Tax=Cyclospora cayetanensis TaxID=88456 RepID=A0A1D3DB62_9EIME|nr:mitochondrial ribosomal protein s35 [Cyclospora cayetanensis]